MRSISVAVALLRVVSIVWSVVTVLLLLLLLLLLDTAL